MSYRTGRIFLSALEPGLPDPDPSRLAHSARSPPVATKADETEWNESEHAEEHHHAEGRTAQSPLLFDHAGVGLGQSLHGHHAEQLAAQRAGEAELYLLSELALRTLHPGCEPIAHPVLTGVRRAARHDLDVDDAHGSERRLDGCVEHLGALVHPGGSRGGSLLHQHTPALIGIFGARQGIAVDRVTTIESRICRVDSHALVTRDRPSRFSWTQAYRGRASC